MRENIKELEKRIGELERKERSKTEGSKTGGEEMEKIGRQNEGERMETEEKGTGRENEEYYNTGNREEGE